jgi:hypothetical protein
MYGRELRELRESGGQLTGTQNCLREIDIFRVKKLLTAVCDIVFTSINVRLVRERNLTQLKYLMRVREYEKKSKLFMKLAYNETVYKGAAYIVSRNFIYLLSEI